MILCGICAMEDIPACAYTVCFSRYQAGWLFSRHQARDTWETQGGHIEPGETWEAAARRELYEESGAAATRLLPVCGYWAARDGGAKRYGVVYLAEVDHLDPLPQSEMAEVRWFAALPENLTYPEITPVLFERVMEAARVSGLA